MTLSPEDKHSKNHTFYSTGKLLITGEYVVLDGANALAVPTKLGQELQVKTLNKPKIKWSSLDEQNNVWLKTSFNLTNTKIELETESEDEITNRLLEILQTAKQLNPKFLTSNKGYSITTKLEFPKIWGLGTSSTLINNIANWANINAYQLLNLTFGGSGYDIACAQNNTPITYKLINNSNLKTEITNTKKSLTPLVNPVNFNPEFKDHLYFVHLNKKQNSREGIAQYKKNTNNLSETILEINTITEQLLACKLIEDFNVLIEKHEDIISGIIKQKPVKQLLFNDFKGSIKSLGAWGGDFILASSINNPEAYFNAKGYNTILKYSDMVK